MSQKWLLLIIGLIFLSGCNQEGSNNVSINSQIEIPTLTNEKVINMINEASRKYHIIVDNRGVGISNCTLENKDYVEINGLYYNYLCSSIDTVEEFKEYLGDVLTDNAIDSIIDDFTFVIMDGKILYEVADAGGGISWDEVLSINQTDNYAEVEVKGIADSEDQIYETIIVKFKYVENRDWRIDSHPGELY